MFYKKSKEKFSQEIFLNPPAEYRGAPFWAWNCAMTEEIIRQKIAEMKEMGMGGMHLHSRTGMNIPYLSERFFELVKTSLKEAEENDMLLWLYDEDRWPSGFGGGFVTRNHQFRSRFLVFSPEDIEGKEFEYECRSSAMACRSTERTLLGCFEVKLSDDGWLEEYHTIPKEQKERAGFWKWYAYLEVSGDNPWFNNEAYVDTLNPEATRAFLNTVHEKYAQEVGEAFGSTIPAIFTDEPQFCHKQRLGFAGEKRQVIIPYTERLEEYFQENYGESLLAALPELFWDRKSGVSRVRYRYHDSVCALFAEAYAGVLGAWCREHKIMLTGHMMEEPRLITQTAALGEAMRSYKSFDIPGVDMLCDRRELTTVKQAQSAAHQYGREGVMSELYGVTNWDFDFRGHKLQGDWQAALGVTVRVHHLNWSSMEGEAKRDYPASIGSQSPWYQEYHFVEDYFARINTALTRGRPIERIGVIHPIESYWLFWGTEEKTAGIREELESGFLRITDWLLYGLQDFDFISESLLAEQPYEACVSDGQFRVGEMAYDVIVVPNCITLRKSTVRRLERFIRSGGRVILTGRLPEYMDAGVSEEICEFSDMCEKAAFTRNALLDALEQYRIVDVRDEKGIRSTNLIYQFRSEENQDWLFLAHVNPMENPDIPYPEHCKIILRGKYKAEECRAITGEIVPVQTFCEKGNTVIEKTMYAHDSLLLRLQKKEENAGIQMAEEMQKQAQEEHLTGEYMYRLSEPNVLVLDMAYYRLDEEPWSADREEILRIDNEMRRRLGYPLRMEALAQPWTDTEACLDVHDLYLRFEIESDVEIKGAKLALENADITEIRLNRERVAGKSEGWYTDRSIHIRSLPELKKGKNTLEVRIPYNRKRNVEAMYILGDFGVTVRGSRYRITKRPQTLAFGDIAEQGFPFYGGNITYEINLFLARGEYSIQTSRFRAPLISVRADGGERQIIAYAPYAAKLGCLTNGMHRIEITVFGNRVNTFGTIHNCNETETWYGPNTWRSEGCEWSYEYCLRKTGILKAPVLMKTI